MTEAREIVGRLAVGQGRELVHRRRETAQEPHSRGAGQAGSFFLLCLGRRATVCSGVGDLANLGQGGGCVGDWRLGTGSRLLAAFGAMGIRPAVRRVCCASAMCISLLDSSFLCVSHVSRARRVLSG